jgi:hypothetical protein
MLAATLLAADRPVAAEDQSGPIPLTDPTQVFVVPPMPRPALLLPVTDPAFGTTITRIGGDTGQPVSPLSGTWGADARHAYSKQQPWNADGSLLMIQNKGSGSPSRLLLDGTTFVPAKMPCDDDPLYDYRWHPSPTRANTMINVTRDGNELMWYDVITCEKTRSWPLPITVDYGIGSGEGNPSNDGRFVCLANATSMVVVDMDPQAPYPPFPTRRIGPVYSLIPCGLDPDDPAGDCTIGNVSISPSGRYVDVKFQGGTSATQDAHRIFRVNPYTLELSPQPMDPASLRCEDFAGRTDGWIYPLKHADLALDPFDNNEDVIIGGRSCPGSSLGRVVKVRLRDGKVTALTDPSNEPSFQHASTRNLDRPGWVYVGYYKSEGRKYSDEIVAVRMDGGAVERFAHKRSATSSCYRCESHPVPSRDGRRILFASNWAVDCADGCGDEEDIKDYVVSLPGAVAIDSLPPLPWPEPRSGASIKLALSLVRPNPAVSRLTLDYTLGINTRVRLEMLDATGRRVHVRDLGRPGPGQHQATVERDGAMPAGVYWLRLTAGSHVATSRVVLVGR